MRRGGRMDRAAGCRCAMTPGRIRAAAMVVIGGAILASLLLWDRDSDHTVPAGSPDAPPAPVTAAPAPERSQAASTATEDASSTPARAVVADEPAVAVITVVDDSGAPVEGVRLTGIVIEEIGPATRRMTRTELATTSLGDGRYAVRAAPTGRVVMLRAERAGHMPAGVAPWVVADTRIVLPRAGRIELDVAIGPEISADDLRVELVGAGSTVRAQRDPSNATAVVTVTGPAKRKSLNLGETTVVGLLHAEDYAGTGPHVIEVLARGRLDPVLRIEDVHIPVGAAAADRRLRPIDLRALRMIRVTLRQSLRRTGFRMADLDCSTIELRGSDGRRIRYDKKPWRGQLDIPLTEPSVELDLQVPGYRPVVQWLTGDTTIALERDESAR